MRVRPRAPDVVTAPKFIDLKRTLLVAVEDESLKAFAAMNRPICAEGGG